MFALDNVLNVTSLKIWLQTKPYLRINELPNMSNEDYIHINSDNKQEPFLLNQESFKLGSIVLVRKQNLNLWDVYKLSIQGNVLKYENVILDKYWNYFKNNMAYTESFIENFINYCEGVYLLSINRQIKLFGDFSAAIDRISDMDKRKTYLTYKSTLLQKLLINIYKDTLTHPNKLKTVTHIFSTKTLFNQLKSCPWIDSKTLSELCSSMESNNGIFQTHSDMLNIYPNIGQHLFGKINEKVFILSKDYLYLYNEKNDKKMRLFSLR